MSRKNRRALLCALLALCLTLTLAACGAAGGGGDGVPQVADDGSADPKICDAYRVGLAQLETDGGDYAELGLSYLSGYSYSMALSGASCLQMTACALLGDTSGLACPDWYAAAALTRAAPYPAFFQGLLCEFKGDGDGAADFYRQAELYYGFSPVLYAFRYLGDASVKELEEIKADCEARIARIGAVYTPAPYTGELSELDFMAGCHQALGDLYAQEGAYAAALDCYDTALCVNPYDAQNYAACAVYALYAGDARAAVYLSEGLTLDPGDAGLCLLSAMLFESQGESETALYYIDLARADAALTAEQRAAADDMAARMGGGA